MRSVTIARIIKRIFDFLAAALGLIVLSPLLLIVAGLIRWKMGGPVLFLQVRPGYKERPFTMFKFRTMREAFDKKGQPLLDKERLTPLGRLLRKTSLDELPELWTVVKGDMSLVGPRPLLMEYIERYTAEQAGRHNVKPGITGWAQIHGRNCLHWEDKFACDVWYVDHWSLWLDLRILLRTITTVLKREGISQPGQATMEEFKGSHSKSP